MVMLAVIVNNNERYESVRTESLRGVGVTYKRRQIKLI